MRAPHHPVILAVVLSLVLHVVVIVLVSGYRFNDHSAAKELATNQVVFAQVLPVRQDEKPVVGKARPIKTIPQIADAPGIAPPAATAVLTSSPQERASMPAPPPPSAEEWAFAAKYTNKNSKGYRYSWGQQVRSMMGTAVEGPDQGIVQFRVEIAPDGKLAKLDTLWTTSAVAEQLARKAIESMPPLPPTPTGKSLIFEKTISFTPYESSGPPSYRDDCIPDTPAFRNPFAWDGQSPQVRVEQPKVEKLDPKALEECLRQLPQDSIEAEMARDRRAMERWGWNR